MKYCKNVKIAGQIVRCRIERCLPWWFHPSTFLQLSIILSNKLKLFSWSFRWTLFAAALSSSVNLSTSFRTNLVYCNGHPDACFLRTYPWDCPSNLHSFDSAILSFQRCRLIIGAYTVTHKWKYKNLRLLHSLKYSIISLLIKTQSHFNVQWWVAISNTYVYKFPLQLIQ
jgi:hypothetical protein